MKLQQLIVDATSVSDRRRNVLVTKSNSIKQELIDQAIEWSTVGGGVFSECGSAVFYCRSRAGTGMVGRSYPCELNDKGERFMRTHWVLVSSNQMKCYYNNAVLFVRILNSSGQWILQTSQFESELPVLEVIDRPVNTFAYPMQEQQVDFAKRAIMTHERVAVSDACQPLDFVGHVLQGYSFRERAKVSFAVDRRVLGDTPFQINAFSRSDMRLEHDLMRHRVFPLRLRSEAVRP